MQLFERARRRDGTSPALQKPADGCQVGTGSTTPRGPWQRADGGRICIESDWTSAAGPTDEASLNATSDGPEFGSMAETGC